MTHLRLLSKVAGSGLAGLVATSPPIAVAAEEEPVSVAARFYPAPGRESELRN